MYNICFTTLWVLNFRPFCSISYRLWDIDHLTVSWIMWSIKQEVNHPNSRKISNYVYNILIIPLWVLNFHPFCSISYRLWDTDHFLFDWSCDPSNRKWSSNQKKISNYVYNILLISLWVLNFRPFCSISYRYWPTSCLWNGKIPPDTHNFALM